MITGFNTDIEFDGITYHIQTEDKGLDNPLILSLVYVGGAILASKRSLYTDLLTSGFDENVLTERLNRQHKLICAAVRSGRIDDLKRMSERDAPAARATATPKTETVVAPAAVPPVEKAAVKPVEKAVVAPVKKAVVAPVEKAAPPPIKPKPLLPVVTKPSLPVEPSPSILDLITDYNDPVTPEAIAVRSSPPLPPPLPPSPSPPTGLPPQTLKLEEEVIPPTAETVEEIEPVAGDEAEELYLVLLDDEGDFRAGELVTVRIRVGRGKYGRVPIPEAAVTVKVLGTTFRPLILSTLTDDNGIAVVRALLPRFTAGRAAILIRAVVDDEAAELRRIIHQA